jgi:hypothetical protein
MAMRVCILFFHVCKSIRGFVFAAKFKCLMRTVHTSERVRMLGSAGVCGPRNFQLLSSTNFHTRSSYLRLRIRFTITFNVKHSREGYGFERAHTARC